jgi:KUP system potassium uptake protein
MNEVKSAAKASLPWLALGAIGVVFGDIGTDGLYVMAACFQETPGLAQDHAAVLGIISLILWAVILVVCVKYLTFIFRADHHGEGGTLALLGLLRENEGDPQTRIAIDRTPRRPGLLVFVVLFGSALLYGDGMITPAISVLSAVEGLNVATDVFKPFVVPLAAAILIALFLIQSRGTERVGKLFGPVMCLWFVTIGALGLNGLLHRPAILVAFNPLYGARFLISHGLAGYDVLGAVVLAVSGAEALFADIGHFGRKPILLAWYGLALPALMLNYLGQGGLILADPKAISNAFFGLVPHWGLYPMVALSTAATVIASQALISGAFSLTQQAVHMGLCPRFLIRQTSKTERGQIYMPVVNSFLMIGCTAIVFSFRSSAALSYAYGLAVVGTMIVTSGVFYLVMRKVWHWSLMLAVPIAAVFMFIDLGFLGGNLDKLLYGAWVPVAIALVVFTLAAIWTDGRPRYRQALDTWAMPIAEFQQEMTGWGSRQEGTAVLLTPVPERVPMVGRHAWLRQQVHHEFVLLITVENADAAWVPVAEQVKIESLTPSLHRLRASFGFMQPVDLDAALQAAKRAGLAINWKELVFYLPQPMESERGNWLSRMRRRIFMFLGSAGLSPMEYFHIKPNQTVSVGLEIDI